MSKISKIECHIEAKPNKTGLSCNSSYFLDRAGSSL